MRLYGAELYRFHERIVRRSGKQKTGGGHSAGKAPRSLGDRRRRQRGKMRGLCAKAFAGFHAHQRWLCVALELPYFG